MNKKHFHSLKLVLQITDLRHIVWDSIDTDAQGTSTETFLIVCCRWNKHWNVMHASHGYFYHMAVCYFAVVNGKLAFDIWVLTGSIHRAQQPTHSLLFLHSIWKAPKLFCFTRLHYSTCWRPVFTTKGEECSLLRSFHVACQHEIVCDNISSYLMTDAGIRYEDWTCCIPGAKKLNELNRQ